MATTTIEQLNSLCLRDAPKHRAWLGQPGLLDWRGRTWTYAINGKALLLLAGATPGLKRYAAAGEQLARILRPTGGKATKVAFADLVRFAGLPVPDTVCTECGGQPETVCPKCQGKKKVVCSSCGGTGEMECSSCGQDTACDDCDGSRTQDCEFCDSEGTVWCAECHKGLVPVPDRFGRIGAVTVSLNLLAQYLRTLTAKRVTVIAPPSYDAPLWIEAADWIVLVMPVELTNFDEADVRVFGQEVA